VYDVAVVGAGINGCAIARELSQAGQRVVVIEGESIAAGGSGAAGAFISPKFSKAGALKELIEEAFVYALVYYAKNFPQAFTKTKLLHIAKDAKEDAVLQIFKEKTTLEILNILDAKETTLTQEAKQREYVSIMAGIVDAKKVCKAMLKGIDTLYTTVKGFEYHKEYWEIDKQYKAKKIVLATGAYEMLLPQPYIKLRGVWGHRIDIRCRIKNKCSIHQFVSIAPSNEQGILAIGATHNVHYHPQKNKEAYDIQSGRKELLQKAAKTVHFEDDVEVVADYMGLRSGSFDYMPIIGALVDSKESLREGSKKFKCKKPDFSTFSYYKDLYMINGSGGYGFVLAPLLAKMLCEHIVEKKQLRESLVPARFFARWVKRCG
jgi:tRNA 5-methylaminomethyl-2-thiouridine biosynthesis bifunctional protein